MEPIRVTTQTGKAPETFGENRTCPECGCRLSRYNPDETCSGCSLPDYRPPRLTRRRNKPAEELEATG